MYHIIDHKFIGKACNNEVCRGYSMELIKLTHENLNQSTSAVPFQIITTVKSCQKKA